MGGLTQAAQNLLGQVQQLFGAANVTVTSTSRSASLNSSLAGASNTSQHLTGNAFDFTVAGLSPAQVQQTIAGSGISFSQSIQEYGAAAGAGTNHLGVGTKGQLLTGVNGKYTTTGYAAAVGAPSVGGGRSYLQSVLGTSAGNSVSDALSALGNGLAAPGNAIDKSLGGLDPSQWYARIAFGLLALILIIAALFMLSGKSVTEVAGKVPPLPV